MKKFSLRKERDEKRVSEKEEKVFVFDSRQAIFTKARGKLNMRDVNGTSKNELIIEYFPSTRFAKEFP